jgi:cell division protein FtsB
MLVASLALLVAAIASFGFVAAKQRQLSQRTAALEARDRVVTQAHASLSLLETRATFLRQEIASLEEDRQALLVIVPEAPRSARLRKKLSGRAAHATTTSAKIAAR